MVNMSFIISIVFYLFDIFISRPANKDFIENENTDRIQSGFEFFLLCLTGIALFCGSHCMYRAIYNAPLVYLQPFATSTLLYSFLLSMLFLNEDYDFYDYLGAFIIFTTNLVRSLITYTNYVKNDDSKNNYLIDEKIEK